MCPPVFATLRISRSRISSASRVSSAIESFLTSAGELIVSRMLLMRASAPTLSIRRAPSLPGLSRMGAAIAQKTLEAYSLHANGVLGAGASPERKGTIPRQRRQACVEFADVFTPKFLVLSCTELNDSDPRTFPLPLPGFIVLSRDAISVPITGMPAVLPL